MKLYATTFGFPVMSLGTDLAIPLEVGAHRRDELMYPTRDDEGDSLSDENPYYGELTGLYWIWKNVAMDPGELLGFRHYNKSLWISMSKAELDLAEGFDFILARKQVIPSYPIQGDLVALRKELGLRYPRILEAFNELYAYDGSSNRCNAKNMFITTRKLSDDYCEFLFDLLPNIRKRIGDVPERRSKRYCALLAERLLSAYIQANGFRSKEVDIRYDRPWMTAAKVVVNRIPFDPNSNLLKALRKRTYNGSYGKEYVVDRK